MENTFENKARFFALYWGQDVARLRDSYAQKQLIKIGELNIDLIQNLELKPLSHMTDEDAAELFLLSWEGREKRYESYKEKPITRLAKIFRDYHYPILSSAQTDRARKLGYATDFDGASVEQLLKWGWVQLKEDNQ